MFSRTADIAGALTVIAFMSIVIVIFSFCMDYVCGRKEEEKETEKTIEAELNEYVELSELSVKSESGDHSTHKM